MLFWLELNCLRLPALCSLAVVVILFGMQVAPVRWTPPKARPAPATLDDAVAHLSAAAKWDYTLNVAIKISTADKNKKKGKARDAFRGMVMLPHPFRASKKIVVFAKGEAAEAAKAAGASVVGERELVADLTSGVLKADVVLASTDMAKELKPDARYLRQLMPTPRKGTVSDDVAALVRSHLQGMPCVGQSHLCVSLISHRSLWHWHNKSR
jgi:ribosomal protein L1